MTELDGWHCWHFWRFRLYVIEPHGKTRHVCDACLQKYYSPFLPNYRIVSREGSST